jgi:hypothetical protein
MDTARVDICYRPIRIAWAIRSNDKDAFRRAVRLTHTLWGGRFNPVVIADRADEAANIIDLFRADLVVPVGDSAEVKDFPKLFPYLISPFMGDGLFEQHKRGGRARLLDVHNAFVYWRGSSEWKRHEENGFRQFVWERDDPLADPLLILTGAYPEPDEIGLNYGEILAQATTCIVCPIEKAQPLPLDLLNRPSLGYLTRIGISRHYSVQNFWDYPGYFIGDADNLDDLVTFWNLRAADINPLQFFDPAHADRYGLMRSDYESRTLASLAHLEEHRRNLAIWGRADLSQEALKHFEGQRLIRCTVDSQFFWNGGNIRPPMMKLGDASSLGVFGQQLDKPRVSFSLNNKPFSDDQWFYTQRLVASVQLFGSNDQHTFHPPYVPEWNEFFSRQMHFQYDRLRIEPERVGIIIDACDHDAFLCGLPTPALAEQLFKSAGQQAQLSAGGLITRQVISRLGGLQGARVFKIPGVRRLLKTYDLQETFSKQSALQMIGETISDHKQLYIEPRSTSTDLTAQMVFEYLVEKGLFRIGVRLICPTCNLPSWIAIDEVKQQTLCDLCGHRYDASRQLVSGIFHYRRTGVFGLEKNTQGAVPVALTLQQLDANLYGFSGTIHVPSYDLTSIAGTDHPPCEIDLAVIIPRIYPDRAEVIPGECKDEGGMIDARDIANLRRIADALPNKRFEPYILLAKLAPFTPDEIALAQTLNGPHQQRVIMLTARELEPYHIFERVQDKGQRRFHEGSPSDLAAATSALYFNAQQ